MKAVNGRLNHASERITDDIYTRARAPLQSDVAERVAGLPFPEAEIAALAVRVALDAIKPRTNEGEFCCHVICLRRDVVEFRALVMTPRPT